MNTIEHLAVIMDGNGRWAESQELPRSSGHERGAEVVREVARHALKRGIPYLTLFAFSSMNWGRPSDEVRSLMDLLCHFLESREREMIEEGICLTGIGEREMLPPRVLELLERVERNTANNRKLKLSLAISYDGRRDLVRATKRLVSLARSGELLPADVREELILSELSTRSIPDVDLLIRTSGERRLSGFLPLEACYAELIFIDKMWPEFTPQDLDHALVEYEQRQRRFGLTRHQLEVSCSPI